MSVKENSGYLKTFDSLSLYYTVSACENPLANALIIHGIGEHSGRYQELKNLLTSLQITAYSMDHRGHGRSGGQRGHVNHFDEYLQDVKCLHDLALNEQPGKKPILFGHSMGGVIAAAYALQYQDSLSALILSSPGFITAMEVPAWKLAMAHFLSAAWPKASFSSGLSADLISRDAGEVQKYVADPLNHGQVSSRWAVEFQKAGRECLKRANEIRLPLLIFHGMEDQIVDCKGSEAFFKQARSEQKELLLFPGLYHECMNEIPSEREKVYAAIQKWLVQHLSDLG